MIERDGAAPRWLEVLCLVMGLPLLFAVVLADIGGLPSRSSDAVPDVVGRAPAAADLAADTATARSASQALPRIPVAVNLAGWRMYVHGTAPEFPGTGLAQAVEPLARAAGAAPSPWRAAETAPAAAPNAYLPQGPPARA